MLKRSHKTIALIPVFAGIFFAADDQTVVVTILPEIMSDLMVEVTDLDRAMWTVTGYLLGYVSVMPIMGKISDIYGRKFIYVASMSVFMLGSIGTGLTNSLGFLEPHSYHDSAYIRNSTSYILDISTSLNWVIVTRFIQAIGAGALIPVTIAIITDSYPSKERFIPMGITGACAEAGAVIGPLWGGLVTQFFSWQWVFWLNIPIGILVIIGIIFLIPNNKPINQKMDHAGSLLIIGAICLITLGCAQSGTNTPMLATFILSGFIFLLSYYFFSKTRSNPILPIDIFKNTQFLAANALHLFYGASLIITLVTIPLMVNTVLSGTSLEGGLILLRMTIAIPIGAIIGGWLSKTFDLRLTACFGLISCATSLFFMSQWTVSINDPTMSLHLLMAGFGFGLIIAPVTTSAMNNTNSKYQGAAAGMISASRFLGMTFGIAALAAWGSQKFQNLLMGIDISAAELGMSGDGYSGIEGQLTQVGLTLFHNFFIVGSILCIIGLIPCIRLVKKS